MTADTDRDLRAKLSAIRREGNDLFTQGRLVEASAKYKEAFSLDPTQSWPLHTLSNAQFELGNYLECLETIRKAEALETQDERKHKLALRRVYCYLYSRQYEKAEDSLVGMKRCPSVLRIAYALEKRKIDLKLGRAMGWEALLEIPRQRTCIMPEGRDWFPRGHDDPKASMSQEELLSRSKAGSGKMDISMFFGGVGDARHPFQQLHHIYAYDKDQRRAANRQEKFHLVCQDIQVHALAKFAIMLRILSEIPTATPEEKELLLATGIFGYGSDIMPKYIRDRLHKVMDDLVADAPKNFGIPWLRCNEKTKSEIVKILKYWSEGAPGVCLQKAFNVQYCQGIQIPSTELPGTPKPFRKMEAAEELDQWRTSRVAYPYAGLLNRLEPDLALLLRKVKGKKTSLRAKGLGEYARKHWVPNFTILQEPEWYLWGHDPDVGATLDEVVTRIFEQSLERPKNPKQASLVELITPWFESIALALSPAHCKAQITIELESDEISHLLDTIRYTTKTRFDSVYLGNIPDYIGGHLFTALHALPVLKENGFVLSKILMNMGAFKEGLPRTVAEYLILSNLDAADSLLGLKRVVADDDQAYQMENMSSLMQQMGMPKFIGLGHPHTWKLSAPRPTTDRLSVEKPFFARWLSCMFFKFAMPVPRDYFGPNYARKIEQPLTLNTFVRLCIYLVENRKFPAHWVGQVIDRLLTIPSYYPTSAKPPLTAPISMREVEQLSGELRPYDVRPFLPELRALLAQFTPVIPFPILGPIIGSDLRRYSHEFVVYDMSIGPNSHLLALAFLAPTKAIENVWVHQNRAWDQLVLSLPSRPVDGGIGTQTVIVSGINWTLTKPLNVPTGTSSQRGVAEFVMEVADIDRMCDGEWTMALFRTDKYTLVSDLELVENVDEDEL